jgi:hypothetical protein
VSIPPRDTDKTQAPREVLRAAIVEHMRQGFTANSVLTDVCRDNQAAMPEVVAAMWDLVEDEVITYSSGARLAFREGDA